MHNGLSSLAALVSLLFIFRCALSLHLLSSTQGEAKVHEQRWAAAAAAAAEAQHSAANSGPLREIELSTPIRYSIGDPIESWLNKLLCLDW